MLTMGEFIRLKSYEQEFYEEIKKRRQNNKENFIQKLSVLVAVHVFKSTGEQITKEEAETVANKMFDVAVEKGDVDELYKIKD